MGKKKTKPAGKRSPKRKVPVAGSKRIDPADYGIDFKAILDEIRPHLEGMTNAEIGELANISPPVVSHYLTGVKRPSLAVLAALADASGGLLVVGYQPPN
jgi:hypothetical protein